MPRFGSWSVCLFSFIVAREYRLAADFSAGCGKFWHIVCAGVLRYIRVVMEANQRHCRMPRVVLEANERQPIKNVSLGDWTISLLGKRF